jgi:hypothetical protein
VRAQADERVVADDPTGNRHRQVLLTHVQHVGADRQRDIRSVVDRQQSVMPTAGVREHFQQRNLLARLQVLLAQLNDVDAPSEHGIEELWEITAGAA